MVEEFELALSIVESGVIKTIINESMGTPELFIASETGSNINTSLKNELNSWKGQVKKLLSAQPIERNIRDEISYYQEVKEYNEEFFIQNIEQIVTQIDANSPFYYQALNLIEQQEIEYNPLFKHHFCEQWYHALFTHLQEEQLKKLGKLDKHKLLRDLYQRADTITQLNEIDGVVDEQKSLRLWDMAKAKLTKKDINNLRKIAHFLQKNSELQQIAEKLGRMANKIDSHQQTRIKIEKIKRIETENVNGAGNIVGIHDSDDLERLLPIEGMFLASPELETIFYKHLADKRLTTYQLQNPQQKNEKVTSFETKSKQVEQDKGPFVIAIDASGSMMGAPEQYAKAFAYGLMQIALIENRDCYIILFSTQQITYELTKEKGLSEVLSFLSYSFNGGTDLAPVLEKSIDLMNGEKYTNADLIVISDFIAPAQPESLLNRITEMKNRKNRFHALNLSKYGNPELLAIFDHHWEYHPSRLKKLKQFLGSVDLSPSNIIHSKGKSTPNNA